MDERDGEAGDTSGTIPRRAVVRAAGLGAAVAGLAMIASPSAASAADEWVPIEDRPPCMA